MTALPDKPSALLTLALDDLEVIEKDPRYEVVMSRWHEPDPLGRGKCSVCLAGAVIARSLGGDHLRYLQPDMFSPDDHHKLRALDGFRAGSYRAALHMLNVGAVATEEAAEELHRAGLGCYYNYRDSPTGFKERMRMVAAKLGERGL